MLDEAIAIGAVDRTLSAVDESFGVADISFLCGPLAATVETLSNLTTPAVVTDVASVKVPVAEAGAHLPRFVGGHPMAGSAVSGPRFASAHLFHGASWAICNDNTDEETVGYVATVISAMGANPVVLSAAEHDAHVATVSHLPRVLASALIELVGQSPGATRLSAGSFRDLTRVASSGATWWGEVLSSNEASVRDAIARLVLLLQSWDRDLGSGDSTQVVDRLVQAERGRSLLGAPVAEVRVVLFDRPGEVGRVGLALSASGVDLRDIQLRHAEYGGGGILTLSINAHETDTLRGALREQGFELED